MCLDFLISGAFSDGATRDLGEQETSRIKTFFRTMFGGFCFFSLIHTAEHASGGKEDSGVHHESDEDEIEIYDVEDATEIVEREIETSLATKDAPEDQDEAAALEILDKIADSGLYLKTIRLLLPLILLQDIPLVMRESDLSRRPGCKLLFF